VNRSTSLQSAWSDARKLLCVRLDSLGDVLMTTPAIAALATLVNGGVRDACSRRSPRPIQRHVTLLTSPAGAAASAYLPDVDEVIAWDAPWVKCERGSDAPGDAVQNPALDELSILAQLRAGHFDAAVIFTVYSQSALPAALLCTWAGIPLRLAYCRENPYGLLSDRIAESEPHEGVRHEVRRQLDLVAHIGAHTDDTRLRFRVVDTDRTRLIARLAAHGLSTDQVLVPIHPGASAASRRYPAERFVALARALAALGCSVVITGSGGERELANGIACAAGVACMAGELSLGELGALLEAAALLISNNSGPVHIAAALGTPVVDLYALTNPQHTPWRVPHRLLFRDVPCRYCYRSTCPEGHHLCLRGVDVDEVLSAACQLLRIRGRALGIASATPGLAGRSCHKQYRLP